MTYKDEVKNKAYKEAYQYPKLEDIHPNVGFALTISPKLQSDSLIQTFFECYDNCISKLQMKYQLLPEISTKSTNLHYHGIVEFKDYQEIVNFYWVTIRELKKHCTFTLKLHTSDEWDKYMVKQSSHLRALMDMFNMPYELTNDTQVYKISKNRATKKVIIKKNNLDD